MKDEAKQHGGTYFVLNCSGVNKYHHEDSSISAYIFNELPITSTIAHV